MMYNILFLLLSSPPHIDVESVLGDVAHVGVAPGETSVAALTPSSGSVAGS